MAEMITFKYLREVQNRERSSAALSKLDPGFYEAVAEYVRRKRKIHERGGVNFTDKKEIENIGPVVRSIYDTRERKIIMGALRSARATFKMENMLPEEQKLFDSIHKLVCSSRKNIESVLEPNGKKSGGSGDPEKDDVADCKTDAEGGAGLVKIKLLEDIPEFADADSRTLGPWSKGDVVDCPEDFAQVFVGGGKAEMADQH